MLGPVQPTEFDLQFSVLGIPVRVIPTFWLLAVVLGWTYSQFGWEYLAAWVAVVFVSIMIHELGHAVMASSFGYPPRIFLYHFGGLAMFTPHGNYTAGKSILITLAGPGVGLAFGGCVILASRLLMQNNAGLSPLWLETIHMLVFANIGWSLLNLLPVLPLDGGQVCRDVCTSLSPRRGELWAIRIALVVAGAVALWAFTAQQLYVGLLFGLMCYQNFQELQQRRYW
ncbi:MAG: hypothetical protein KF861_13825 [Planctomycetaceae bacterium]|nr:hypothetical protein [Planctomycetaceae bacterium]